MHSLVESAKSHLDHADDFERGLIEALNERNPDDPGIEDRSKTNVPVAANGESAGDVLNSPLRSLTRCSHNVRLEDARRTVAASSVFSYS